MPLNFRCKMFFADSFFSLLGHPVSFDVNKTTLRLCKLDQNNFCDKSLCWQMKLNSLPGVSDRPKFGPDQKVGLSNIRPKTAFRRRTRALSFPFLFKPSKCLPHLG